MGWASQGELPAGRGSGLSVDEWGRKNLVNVTFELASESVQIIVKLIVAMVLLNTF